MCNMKKKQFSSFIHLDTLNDLHLALLETQETQDIERMPF